MRLSNRTFQKINRSRAVQDAVARKAQRVAATARSITANEGGTASITVVSGVRPGGRAYTNVVSSSRDEEYGTETTPRIRALGRAARAN
ncbi:hypothetical protein SAMN05444374_11631 [Rhodococcoides kroppenstedtii]|uniref:Uncharacterized protein n=1 Tax=Rhodococcoides kroppenstedtii TaxID=293050 RepID=A0A1I0U9U8_9NOCA|nr:hypothetical protein [Rhodococcus kroppenstedtii]SFA60815.1 hypothetical protein SAMN05444374_11631 [Rhodococcus kroppenstedtii]